MNLHEVAEKYAWLKLDIEEALMAMRSNRIVFGELSEHKQDVLRAVNGHRGLEIRCDDRWRPRLTIPTIGGSLTFRVAQGFDFQEAWAFEEANMKPAEMEWHSGKRLGAMYEAPDGVKEHWSDLPGLEFDGWMLMGFSNTPGEEWHTRTMGAMGAWSPFCWKSDDSVGMFEYAVWKRKES